MRIIWIILLVLIGLIISGLLTVVIILWKKCPEAVKMLSNFADGRCEKCQVKLDRKYPNRRKRNLGQYALTIVKWGAIISIPVILKALLEWKIRRHLPTGSIGKSAKGSKGTRRKK
jgi:hypothetical protein